MSEFHESISDRWDIWLRERIAASDPRLTCKHPYIYDLGNGNTSTGWCNKCREIAVQAYESGEMPPTREEILAEERALTDKVWYNRHLVLRERVEDGTETVDPKIWEGALRAAKETEERHPGELGPYDDFEWGMLNGKLSALRWVLGEDWDQLDT